MRIKGKNVKNEKKVREGRMVTKRGEDERG